MCSRHRHVSLAAALELRVVCRSCEHITGVEVDRGSFGAKGHGVRRGSADEAHRAARGAGADPDERPAAQVEQTMFGMPVVDPGSLESGPIRPGEQDAVGGVDTVDQKQWGGARPALVSGASDPGQSVPERAQSFRHTFLGPAGRQWNHPGRVEVDGGDTERNAPGELFVE